jgi:hypothetical protein
MFGHRIIQTIQSPFPAPYNVWRRNEPVVPTLSSSKLLYCTNGQMMSQILSVVNLSLIFTECHLKTVRQHLEDTPKRERWTSSLPTVLVEISTVFYVPYASQKEPTTNIKTLQNIVGKSSEHTMVHELAQHPRKILVAYR